MEWVGHFLVATIVFFIVRFFYKKLSFSLFILGSTLFIDFDHALVMIARKTFFRWSCSPVIYMLFESHNWTHTIVFVLFFSLLLSFLFKDKKVAFWSVFWGMIVHLAVDAVSMHLILGQGSYWFWPIFYHRI